MAKRSRSHWELNFLPSGWQKKNLRIKSKERFSRRERFSLIFRNDRPKDQKFEVKILLQDWITFQLRKLTSQILHCNKSRAYLFTTLFSFRLRAVKTVHKLISFLDCITFTKILFLSHITLGKFLSFKRVFASTAFHLFAFDFIENAFKLQHNFNCLQSTPSLNTDYTVCYTLNVTLSD